MTELERLLRIQLEQSQRENQNFRSEIQALQRSLQTLQSELDRSVESYSSIYTNQSKVWTIHKSTIDQTLSSFREEMNQHKSMIDKGSQESAAALSILNRNLNSLNGTVTNLIKALES